MNSSGGTVTICGMRVGDRAPVCRTTPVSYARRVWGRWWERVAASTVDEPVRVGDMAVWRER